MIRSMKLLSRKIIICFAITACLFILFWLAPGSLNFRLEDNYRQNLSFRLLDRHGRLIFTGQNASGNHAVYLDRLPGDFKRLVIKKEDRHFFRHFGINPFSVAQNLGNKFGLTQRKGSSTISQQTAKILLSNENERTLKNKAIETLYALGLEFSKSKEEILLMYANSAYFGNNIQGLETASLAYFGVTADLLSKEQTLQLLTSLNNPTNNNPAAGPNIEASIALARNLNVGTDENNFTSPDAAEQNLKNYVSASKPVFELKPYLSDLPANGKQEITLDKDLNEKVREITRRNIELLQTKKAKNAAVVILRLPDNEILSLVGSPDPDSYSEGYQINMAAKPRQIGSTIKPFIYLKGFEKGMRPYTIIDDREYKYPAAEGFDIYPRNYDRLYHGKMTAHYALANSINVCAVKTLEYVGMDGFRDFLINSLGYEPVQDFSNYQLGVALGALEMDLLNLSRIFTIFPQEGNLENLNLFFDGKINSRFFPYQNKAVAKKEYVRLINKILSDRKIAMDQFGGQSSLNLPYENYALKTGTSHDYTDSWVIGYTPDFLVGVWVGNADSSAMEGVSGQLGAGLIWSETMQVMLNSEYNRRTAFDFSGIAEYRQNGSLEYGLENDDYERSKNVIEALDNSLILKPHEGDIFQFEKNAGITLTAEDIVRWEINGTAYGSGKELFFYPPSPGQYKISASNEEKFEEATIIFVEKNQ